MNKKILIFSLLTIIFSINSVFANSDYRQRNSRNYARSYHYQSNAIMYPPNQYQEYYHHRHNPNDNFVRNMYIISKMAEQNPGVKYKYTSTSAVYL